MEERKEFTSGVNYGVAALGLSDPELRIFTAEHDLLAFGPLQGFTAIRAGVAAYALLYDGDEWIPEMDEIQMFAGERTGDLGLFLNRLDFVEGSVISIQTFQLSLKPGIDRYTLLRRLSPMIYQ